MSAVGIREVFEQRRKWFYERNPLGRPVTWLVVDTTTGDAVGCASVLPRRIRFDGQLLIAGIMCDFVVSPKHRIAGPALVLQRALLEQSHQHGFVFVYGSPNDEALPIFKRIGVKCVGTASSWHKPLRLRSDLAKVIGSRISSRLPSAVRGAFIEILSRTGAALGDPFLPLLDWVRGRRAPHRSRWSIQPRTSGIHDAIRELSAPGTRFERILERCYLDWRYAEFTTSSSRIFTLLTEGTDTLIGVIVFREQGDRVLVLDAAWKDASGAAQGLFSAFFQAMRAIGASTVLVDSYVGHDGVRSLLRQLGFLRRPISRPLIAYVGLRAPTGLRAAVFQECNWALFGGELDI